MKIDEQTVDKIAHLARLGISSEEKTEMVETLSRILDWMEQLNEVDTTGVEPLIHMSPAVNVFREDRAENTLSREKGSSMRQPKPKNISPFRK